MLDELATHLEEALAGDGRRPVLRERLVRLMTLLAGLPPPPDPLGLYPGYGQLHAAFLDACRSDDGGRIEEAFLELYCHLHRHEAPYTPAERAVLDASGGYWCHAGGLTPILLAPDWVQPHTLSLDLGAGNGLQLLLVQALAPHALTVQVEIAGAMVASGRELQRWLGIDEPRVAWVQEDVRSVSPAGFDLVYLYRPLRPEGAGEAFYSALAAKLRQAAHPVAVFSVADCLRPFLGPGFEVVHDDGQLVCFVRGDPRVPRSDGRGCHSLRG